MNVFDLRKRLVGDYASYTRSFIKIADARIAATVESALHAGEFWPEPLLQLNPTFLPGGTIDAPVADRTLHAECAKIFRIDKSGTDHTGKDLLLHTHQRGAILKAKEGKSYVLTSGTGSGKSLAYIMPIVAHVLQHASGRGIQAIVVYPMNALANSQNGDLGKFLDKGDVGGRLSVRFGCYTGQEKAPEKEAIQKDPPDILLTNYMMLEFLLTRSEDRELVRAAQGLRFLVFDELHTYRGRQGADVALLIRRCRQAFGGHDILCTGCGPSGHVRAAGAGTPALVSPPPMPAFTVMPRRWGVAQTSAWMGRARRLRKADDYLPASRAAMISWAMSRLLLRRLARQAPDGVPSPQRQGLTGLARAFSTASRSLQCAQGHTMQTLASDRWLFLQHYSEGCPDTLTVTSLSIEDASVISAAARIRFSTDGPVLRTFPLEPVAMTSSTRSPSSVFASGRSPWR